jgi:hypothetical protein
MAYNYDWSGTQRRRPTQAPYGTGGFQRFKRKQGFKRTDIRPELLAQMNQLELLRKKRAAIGRVQGVTTPRGQTRLPKRLY